MASRAEAMPAAQSFAGGWAGWLSPALRACLSHAYTSREVSHIPRRGDALGISWEEILVAPVPQARTVPGSWRLF